MHVSVHTTLPLLVLLPLTVFALVALVDFFRTPKIAFASGPERVLIGVFILFSPFNVPGLGPVLWFGYFRSLLRDRIAFRELA